jgi:hypothetical protein
VILEKQMSVKSVDSVSVCGSPGANTPVAPLKPGPDAVGGT